MMRHNDAAWKPKLVSRCTLPDKALLGISALR
jgi:hypothetical protein